jgi:hypothetical protein
MIKNKIKTGNIHPLQTQLAKQFVAFSMLVIPFLPTGCARFKTVQTDMSYENGTPIREITTKATSTTFFDSDSALASFKATQTDKTQSASVGSLNQQSSGSNTVVVLEAVERILNSVK